MEGFSILEARDGKSALNFIQKFKIDLAIIDIMMPNINGYELIKIVRKEYKMPIIILSAKNQEMDKIMGLGLEQMILYRNHSACWRY